MRPFKSTISLTEARRLLAAGVRPIARTERVALVEAAGRVVAAEVAATIDVPPFARSAMDGYAVVASDTRGAARGAPIRLRIVDRIHTGELPRNRIDPGTCAEIATGAPLPGGADAVVMVEETAAADGTLVEILAEVSPGQNIGRRGADITAGDLVVRRGDHLNASRIGAIAAIGCPDVEVYARPRVAVLSTGNEIIDPGAPLAGGQIYDVNRFTLGAVIADHGGTPETHRRFRTR
jgi:molybdopterin biosynthesis enzyme